MAVSALRSMGGGRVGFLAPESRFRRSWSDSRGLDLSEYSISDVSSRVILTWTIWNSEWLSSNDWSSYLIDEQQCLLNAAGLLLPVSTKWSIVLTLWSVDDERQWCVHELNIHAERRLQWSPISMTHDEYRSCLELCIDALVPIHAANAGEPWDLSALYALDDTASDAVFADREHAVHRV